VAEYALPAGGPGSLEVYDSWGQRVGVVAQGRLGRGVHAASWNPGRLSAGEYWLRLRAGGLDLLRRSVLA